MIEYGLSRKIEKTDWFEQGILANKCHPDKCEKMTVEQICHYLIQDVNVKENAFNPRLFKSQKFNKK